MTRLINKEIICLHCESSFQIIWEASINTWLNPELIQKLLDDKYYYNCPRCNYQIHLVTKILINCPKSMFWISNDEDIEIKKKILKEYEVIDDKGKILTPIMGVDRPVESHPSLTSDVGKIIEKLKNDLLSNNKTHSDNEKK